MNALAVIALKEIRDGIRNRWVISCILVLALLAVSQLLLGSAPGGSLKADPMAVTVVSLSSLSVYLIPLIALMLRKNPRFVFVHRLLLLSSAISTVLVAGVRIPVLSK